MRRAVNEAFNSTASKRYHVMQEEEAARLALALAKGYEQFHHHYERYAASLVLTITYDRPLRDSAEDERLLSRCSAFPKTIAAAVAPGAYYVEFMPWMLHIPARYVPTSYTLHGISYLIPSFAQWKRTAAEGYTEITSFFNELVADVIRRRVSGTSHVRSYLGVT
jgi:hypothetical protein